jgi:hypothetical protein
MRSDVLARHGLAHDNGIGVPPGDRIANICEEMKMHGYFGDLRMPREAIISPSLGCVIVFSLVGLALSAVVLAINGSQSLDNILAALG